MKKELLNLIDETLRFHYLRGAEKTEAVNSTIWMTNPENVLSTMVSDGESEVVFQGISKVMKRRQGDTFFVPAGTSSRSAKRFPTSDSYCWAHLRFTILNDFDLLSLLKLKPILFQGKTSDQLGAMLRELAVLWQADPECGRISTLVSTKSMGFSILNLILKNSRTDVEVIEQIVHIERFIQVFDYINRNIDRRLTTRELAEKANLSPYHFQREFKKATGFSPVEYARKKRTQKARELLLATDSRLVEIADSLGYPDQFTFSKNFKRATGFSPKNYRKNIFVN